MRKVKSGGGWQAVRYSLLKAKEVGPIRLAKAMTSKNACKTCALGMGGQQGGMRNEAGHFPEVCKKSLQAMASDMQGRISDQFFSKYSIDHLKSMSSRELEHCGRLVTPLLAGPTDSHYQPISWERALQVASESLKTCDPDRAFFYSSGRSSNEAGFLLNVFARAFGTNHVTNCSFYCHQASSVALKESVGTGTATVNLEDLDQCDVVVLLGGNPASNHPRLMTKLVEVRERGGEVIVVNPIKETGLVQFRVPSRPKSLFFGSEVASLYLQPKIGGDIALLLGVVKRLLESECHAAEFIETHTKSFQELKDLVLSTPWNDIVSQSGVEKSEIESVANKLTRSKRAIFAWTMGMTHHQHGVENVRWIVNLALITGMVGKPGAGLMPIRGHSNVQGMGSLGVTPAVNEALFDKLESFGLSLNRVPGLDTLASIEACNEGGFDFGLCLGGNLYGASPDSNFTSQALSRLKTIVYLSTTLNTGHAFGRAQSTLVLPVLARDEEAQSTTQESMFSYVRLSDGGQRRLEGPRSEVEVIAETAVQVFGPHFPIQWSVFKGHEEIRSWIAELVPGYGDAALIGASKKEFEIPGRIIHSPDFKTIDGKANFFCGGIDKDHQQPPGSFLLMTIRSEGQFNTVVYEEEDLYRGQERRDVILMNPEDRMRQGWTVDQRVDIVSACGKMSNLLVRDYDISRGCVAMYAPEANKLVPRTADPLSRTPAFKSVPVEINLSAHLI